MAKSSIDRLFSRYKRSTDGKRGCSQEWAKQAESIRTKSGDIQQYLDILGLTVPFTLNELSRVWRAAMTKAHPDKPGGSHELAQKLNEAYASLSQTLKIESNPQIVVANPSSSEVLHPPRCAWELPEDLSQANLLGDLKVDGERLVVYLNHNPYTGVAQTTLLTRHIGKHTKQYGDRTAAHPGISQNYSSVGRTVLDCELFQGSLYCFDIPFYKGQDLRKLPLIERRKFLIEAIGEIQNPLITITPSWSAKDHNLTQVFQNVIDTGLGGGEGLIIKDLTAVYGSNWAKLKKSYDVSCIITGFRDGTNALDGMVGSFILSVYNGNDLVEVGAVKLGKNKLHEEVTANKEKYLGKVVDVYTQELTVHNKLRHATFHRIREDGMNPGDCTMEKLKADMRKVAKSKRQHAA